MQQRQTDEKQPTTAIQSPSLEKMTPKYCNAGQVALLNQRNLVLSLSFNEPNQPTLLIERVMIDLEHADNLANVLKAAVTEAQETETTTLLN